MNPKEKDDEIIKLTDEELDEIFADDDFDNSGEDGEIRSFYFSNPDPYAKDSGSGCLCDTGQPQFSECHISQTTA